ncbi:hypothetical protein ABID58_006357 [Bradyrhizobium sp. S3.2.6]
MPGKVKSSSTKRVTRRNSPKRATERGKSAVIDRYGTLPIAKSGAERKRDIDWLEKNFVQAVRLFGSETVQRKLCDLKGIYFDGYDDPNN